MLRHATPPSHAQAAPLPPQCKRPHALHARSARAGADAAKKGPESPSGRCGARRRAIECGGEVHPRRRRHHARSEDASRDSQLLDRMAAVVGPATSGRGAKTDAERQVIQAVSVLTAGLASPQKAGGSLIGAHSRWARVWSRRTARTWCLNWSTQRDGTRRPARPSASACPRACCCTSASTWPPPSCRRTMPRSSKKRLWQRAPWCWTRTITKRQCRSWRLASPSASERASLWVHTSGSVRLGV